MKITGLETFAVDGGWRAWTYVKVETDEGLTGWGECSDTRVPNAVAGAVRDLSTVLIGQDPRAYEAVRRIKGIKTIDNQLVSGHLLTFD